MDFLSNLIKRPNSIGLTERESAVPASQSTTPSPTTLISLAMDRGSIDADSLENLFDSAAQDLDCLEKQHEQLIDVPCPDPAANVSVPSSRETIRQLLNEINFNLDQVTAREMEHLQAMSLELSPLAMKPATNRHSLEQQKALVAAMRSTSLPGTPTTAAPNIVEAFRPREEAEPPLLKFAGLPEFDETQIPELAPLSADMEAQLKEDVCTPSLKLGDHDYNSDSDIYAECLSVNSGKFLADQSELEAYSSALTATTLDNTLSEPDSAHDNSCEPMDVDDINETMELLKDVLAPEDHQLLQQQFLGGALQQQEQKEEDLQKQVQQPAEEQKQFPEKMVAGPILPLIEEQQKQAMEQHQQQQEEEQKQAMHQQKQCLEQKESNLQELPLKQEECTQAEQLMKLKQSLQQEQVMQSEQSSQQNQVLQHQQSSKDKASIFQQKQSPQLEKSLQQLRSMQQEQFIQSERQQEQVLPQKQSPQQAKQEQSLHQEQSMQEQKQSPQLDKPQQKQLLHEEQNLNQYQSVEQPDQVQQQKQCLQQEPVPQLEQVYMPEAAVAAVSPPLPTEEIQEKGSQSFEQSAQAATENTLETPQTSAVSELVSEAVEKMLERTPPREVLMSMSPPIPTHRTKTAEELAMLLALEAYAEPLHVLEKQQDLGSVQVIPLVTVAPIPKQASPLPALDIKTGDCSTHTSPAFPLRSPVESSNHFPHSPHAPPEQDEMPYLEQAIVNPATEHTPCLSGVLARSPLPIELTMTQASPEQLHHQQQELNSTVALGGGSPLNGTFNNASPEFSEAPPSRTTFGVPLSAAPDKQRRTFSVKQEDNPLNATYGMPLQQRRTFVVEDAQRQQLEEPLRMRRTFSMEQVPSPAVEATEENVVGDDLEPMEVDTSVCVETTSCASQSPPLPTHQTKHLEQLKRQAIHGDVFEEQPLSVKEQLSASDEKEDVYVDHFGAMSPITDDIFKQPPCISSLAKTKKPLPTPSLHIQEQFSEADFQDGASNNNIILNSSDFDYLYTKGSNNAPIDRSSLLLKFDPLLGAPVPVNQSNKQQQERALVNILGSIASNNNLARALSPTLEEHETSGSNQSFVIESSAKTGGVAAALAAVQKDYKPPVDRTKKHAKMSVDVIDNDCNKTFDNSNLNSEDKTHKYNNMDELEKKIKNEVTRSEDIEKKLKDAEQREEALVKRITEKDKTNSKLNGVIEAYEKAIAELIHDKEQLVQNHERQMQDVQTDRDSNYHHLTSLETTFSDLHVKYEKSKEMTSQLKQIEDNLLDEKKKLMDKLRQQEQRYEQMKSHAMQQMEIANKKLATLTKEHTDEVKKLKALLKKEEVSRISTAEQLQQKSRENADLLKICEELIYDKGQGGSS